MTEDPLPDQTAGPPKGAAVPPGPAPPPTPPARRLRRRSDSAIGGVAGGIADYLGIDTTVVRIAFVVLAVAGGSGVLLYLAGWILLPDETDTDPRPIALKSGLPSVIFGAIVLLLAASALLNGFSFGFDDSAVAAVLLVGVGLFLLNQRNDQAAAAFAGAPAGPPPPPVAVPSGDATTHWATPRVNDGPLDDRPIETGPQPPITSVTLAVAAVVVGVLLTIDQLTSADIGAAAIFGSVVALCGLGLLVSAFIGRAIPLVPVAILALVGMALAPLADAAISGGFGPREIQVTDQSDLEASYEVGGGYIELDLRQLDLVSDESIEIDVGAGYALLLLPSDTGLDIVAESRAGYVDVLGREQEGINAGIDRSFDVREGQPTLNVDADVTFGYIEVRRG